MARAKYPVIDGKKFCSWCKETRPASEFRTLRQRGFEFLDSKCIFCSKKYHAKYARKWHSEHKEQHRESMREWKSENKERHRFLMWRSHIRRKYGLSPEDYNRLIGDDPHCAICGTKEFGGRYDRPHIDHCHKTHKVRGALCLRCNVGVGVAEMIPNWNALCGAYLLRDKLSDDMHADEVDAVKEWIRTFRA
jgi:hypothetical protein